MFEFLKSLRDAPVANVLLLLGFVFLVMAVAGRVILSSGKLDPPGRWLAGLAGVLSMTAGGWIGYRISATSLKGTAPISVAAVTPTPMAHVASSDSARLLARTPVTVPSPSVVAIDSPASYVDWGCEERKELSLSYQLPPGAGFISANVLPAEIDKAKTFNLLPPVYDADSHTVRTTAIFNGLDKFLFNCAGGGHARVYLRVTYSNPPLG